MTFTDISIVPISDFSRDWHSAHLYFQVLLYYRQNTKWNYFVAYFSTILGSFLELWHVSNQMILYLESTMKMNANPGWNIERQQSQTKWQLRELAMPPRTRREAILIKVRLASPILFVVWQLELSFCAEKKFGRGSVTQLPRQLWQKSSLYWTGWRCSAGSIWFPRKLETN